MARQHRLLDRAQRHRADQDFLERPAHAPEDLDPVTSWRVLDPFVGVDLPSLVDATGPGQIPWVLNRLEPAPACRQATRSWR